jgi:hypothetical protein
MAVLGLTAPPSAAAAPLTWRPSGGSLHALARATLASPAHAHINVLAPYCPSQQHAASSCRTHTAWRCKSHPPWLVVADCSNAPCHNSPPGGVHCALPLHTQTLLAWPANAPPSNHAAVAASLACGYRVLTLPLRLLHTPTPSTHTYGLSLAFALSSAAHTDSLTDSVASGTDSVARLVDLRSRSRGCFMCSLSAHPLLVAVYIVPCPHKH